MPTGAASLFPAIVAAWPGMLPARRAAPRLNVATMVLLIQLRIYSSSVLLIESVCELMRRVVGGGIGQTSDAGPARAGIDLAVTCCCARDPSMDADATV